MKLLSNASIDNTLDIFDEQFDISGINDILRGLDTDRFVKRVGSVSYSNGQKDAAIQIIKITDTHRSLVYVARFLDYHSGFTEKLYSGSSESQEAHKYLLEFEKNS